MVRDGAGGFFGGETRRSRAGGGKREVLTQSLMGDSSGFVIFGVPPFLVILLKPDHNPCTRYWCLGSAFKIFLWLMC